MDHDDSLEQTTEQIKLNPVWYIVLFLGGLFIFVLVSFPYGVLKEFVSVQISNSTGIEMRIGELGWSLPIGVKVENLEVIPSDGGSSVKLKQLRANLSLLALFTGKVGASVDAESERGELEVDVAIPIGSVFGGNPVPSNIELSSKQFPVGGFAELGLGKAAQADKSGNPIVKELLRNIAVKGELDGTANFKIDTSDPIRSNGNADLKLLNAELGLKNPDINISKQKFQTAGVKAVLSEGQLTVDKASRFRSQALDLGIEGRMSLRDPLSNSQLNFDLFLKLEQDLKENYGFLLGQEGVLEATFRGTLARVSSNVSKR